jgi:hypothetical protein
MVQQGKRNDCSQKPGDEKRAKGKAKPESQKKKPGKNNGKLTAAAMPQEQT